MDGVDCPFVKLDEIDAWTKARESGDFYVALFTGLLTERDIEFLQSLRIWGDEEAA